MQSVRRALPDPSGLLRAWLSTSALYLSGVYLPVGGLVLMVFTPQPGLRLERRDGMTSLLALIALVAGTVGLAGGAMAALFYVAGFALLTLVLPVLLRKGWSVEFTVGSIVLLLLSTIAAALVLLGATPEALSRAVAATLEEGRATLLEMYRDAGLGIDRVEELDEATAIFTRWTLRLAPALVAILLGVTVLLNVWLVRWQQRRVGASPVFGDLTRWRVPTPLVWVLIASGYGILLPESPLRIAALNVLAVVLAVYFLQGVAILQFWFGRWRSPRWTRALVYAVVAIEWLVAIAVMLLGIFDLWGDFRRLTPRPVEDDD